jgi:glycogen synthase
MSCCCALRADGYAWECQTQEGGWGLDAVVRENAWKLRGIVNGIDYKEWSPMTDVHLATDGYCQYDMETLEQGKKQCKVCWLPSRARSGMCCICFCRCLCYCFIALRRVMDRHA